MKRLPWMFIGLAMGFIGAMAVDPGVFKLYSWPRDDWRYFAIIRWPIIGAACGAVLNIGLTVLFRFINHSGKFGGGDKGDILPLAPEVNSSTGREP